MAVPKNSWSTFVRFLSFLISVVAILAVSVLVGRELWSYFQHQSALEEKKLLAAEKSLSLKNPPSQESFNPRYILEEQPPISTPQTLAAEAVGAQIQRDELVLGVEVNGQSRAYPINMMTGPTREIVNDVLGGRAIAATW